MRYESNLLKPHNRCKDVPGIEVKATPFGWHPLLSAFSSKSFFRVVVEAEKGHYVAGMLIDKKSQEIVAIYTDPCYRRKRYASMLIHAARQVCPELHVQHMTQDGRKFFKFLGMTEE